MISYKPMPTIRSQIKKLKKAIQNGDDNPFLYKEEELRFMKNKLREIVDANRRMEKEDKGGFGV